VRHHFAVSWHPILTVVAYETARMLPSGENKQQESNDESSFDDDCSVFVKDAIDDIESPKSKTMNFWFSVITRCWPVGENEIDGSTAVETQPVR